MRSHPPRQPPLRQPLRRVWWPLVLVPLAVLPPTPAAAREAATVQEILDGREFYVDGREARVKQRAAAPQEISTRKSRGQIRFDTGAAGRVNRFSQLRLGSGCFLLRQGQILVSGPQSGCTRSARMSVRGTNYILEVREDGQAELSVLEGAVEVEPLRDGEAVQDGEPPQDGAPAPSTRVEAGQRVTLSPAGVVLTLLRLNAGDYNAIFGGSLFEGFSTPLPAFGSLESYVRRYVPGVNLPSLPVTPSLPIPGLSFPRFF
ncbi:FecR domain-containing protein [Cyanobium sp. NIES-981]|uniref:FecR domain-containing protein n=1 Tax=Cyanobium sp. NIES-981 TaxID=1851505 RepID=UPI000B34B77D|nr:FecR domain-containing protein [Cyanobium sp. NIES-981]